MFNLMHKLFTFLNSTRPHSMTSLQERLSNLTDPDADEAAEHEAFVEEVASELSGSGMRPEEAFDGGLAGLIGKHEGDFTRVPDVDRTREEIYARLDYLDVFDLEE